MSFILRDQSGAFKNLPPVVVRLETSIVVRGSSLPAKYNAERESGSTVSFEDYRANESRTAPFEAGQTFSSVIDALGTGRNACPTT
jgi:hypothetical protein